METILSYRSGRIAETPSAGGRTLVDGVAFSVGEGESLALVGETGSGKTMTALSVMRLLPSDVVMKGGSICFEGRELKNRRELNRLLGKRIVYIPQNGAEFLNPARTVRKQLYDSLKKLGLPRGELRRTALDRLRAAGFEEPEAILPKYPFQLSGGMAQRVTIAVSACSEARLIIADEPTNGLDAAGRERFMRMLNELFPKAARLIITHDIGIASLCDRALVLLGGRPMECGAASEVLGAPRHPYTKALIGSLVENGMRQTPRLREPEGSCPFYSRCGSACEACLGEIGHRAENSAEWWCSGA